jgi:hypothetical protein
MSSGASATRSKKQAKGPRYAKDAAVGDWVHIKGIHVTSQAELKRIFGTKGLSKFLSGMVVEWMLLTEPCRKGWFYKVEYLLPNGELVSAVIKAIQHFPDKWVDPDPPPESVAHGTITKTILYKGCTGGKLLHQSGYYKALMDEMIDFPLKIMPVTRQQRKTSEAEPGKVGTAGRGLHLTPTKRKKPADETYSERRRQSRCRNCNAKTIMVCNYCRDDPNIGEKAAAYCCPTTDRDCYSRHMAEHHS